MDKKILKRLLKQHTVLGAVSSCFLIFVFVCGSLLFFRGQLLNWQFAWQQTGQIERSMSWQRGISDVAKQKPEWINGRLTITTDPQNQRMFQVYVGHEERYLFDNQSEKIYGGVKHQDSIADFLYFMHINLTTGIGRDILLIASWLLIMVCVSGILIRWKDLVTKFHQYRMNGKARDVFKDSHVLLGLGVFAFCLMYGVTSAYFNGSYQINAPIYQEFAEKNENNYWHEIGFVELPSADKNNTKLSADNINKAISNYQSQYPDHRIARFDIYSNPITRMRIKGESDRAFDFVTAFYDVHGELIDISKDSYAVNAYTLMVQLHDGHILGKFSHFIYFTLTLMAIASMFLGNVYWIAIREKKRQGQVLFRLQRALLEAGSSGALVTVAVLLLVTKLFAQISPLSTLTYQAITIVCFLSAGSVSLLHYDSKVTSRWLLQFAGGIFLLLPLYDLVRLMLGYKPYSVAVSDLLSIHFAFAALGGFCFALAKIVVKVSDKVTLKSTAMEPDNGCTV